MSAENEPSDVVAKIEQHHLKTLLNKVENNVELSRADIRFLEMLRKRVDAQRAPQTSETTAARDEDDELSAEDFAFVEILGTCKTYTEAARRLDISRRTVHRKLQDTRLAAAVKVRREEFLDHLQTRWAGLGEKALNAIELLLDGEPCPAMVRAALANLKSLGIARNHAPPKRSYEAEKLEIGTLKAVKGQMVVEDPKQIPEALSAPAKAP